MTRTRMAAILAVVMTVFWIGLAPARAVGPRDLVLAEPFQSEVSSASASLWEEPPEPVCPEPVEAWRAGCASDTWRVTADALFLQRRDPAAAVLIVNTDDATENLNADDFDFGVHAGVDVSLARQLGECLGVEVRYFGVDQWSARAGALTTAGDLLQVNATPPVSAWAGTGIAAAYASELHNLEINGQYRLLQRWMLLAGFRYAELDEHLTADLIAADEPFHYATATRNRLYGFQLGTAVTLWDRGGPLSIEAVGKAGIFGNAAAQDSAYETGLVTQPARGTASSTAFLGEIGIAGDFRLTDRWSVRGGYRLLWIDGVALATDQVAASDFVFHRGIDPTGDVFYHGAFVGLKYVR